MACYPSTGFSPLGHSVRRDSEVTRCIPLSEKWEKPEFHLTGGILGYHAHHPAPIPTSRPWLLQADPAGGAGVGGGQAPGRGRGRSSTACVCPCWPRSPAVFADIKVYFPFPALQVPDELSEASASRSGQAPEDLHPESPACRRNPAGISPGTGFPFPLLRVCAQAEGRQSRNGRQAAAVPVPPVPRFPALPQTRSHPLLFLGLGLGVTVWAQDCNCV